MRRRSRPSVLDPRRRRLPRRKEMKRCQFCAEEVQDAAIVCKHCGRSLTNDSTHDRKATNPVVIAAVVLGGLALFVYADRFIGSTIAPQPSAVTEVRRAVAGPSGVTLAQYQALETGMSYAEAVQILGRAGTEISRGDLANIVTVMYAWEGDGGVGANMNAMFQNDKLVTKAQLGLK